MTGVDAAPAGTGSARDRTLLAQVAEITVAYATRNHPSIDELPGIIASIFQALSNAGEKPPAVLKPAVSIRESIRPDYLVCLEDGRRLKLLKGHLRSAFGMTPDQYRAKWGLAADYPMVAPSYALTRSRLAVAFGLGKPRGRGVAKPVLGAVA